MKITTRLNIFVTSQLKCVVIFVVLCENKKDSVRKKSQNTRRDEITAFRITLPYCIRQPRHPRVPLHVLHG